MEEGLWQTGREWGTGPPAHPTPTLPRQLTEIPPFTLTFYPFTEQILLRLGRTHSHCKLLISAPSTSETRRQCGIAISALSSGRGPQLSLSHTKATDYNWVVSEGYPRKGSQLMGAERKFKQPHSRIVHV